MALFTTAASADDALEAVSTGAMDLTNTGATGQKIDGTYHYGFRFPSVTIAQGATITSASLTFDALGGYSGLSTTLDTVTAYGEKVANAAQFTSTSSNISGRTRTTASVFGMGPDNGSFSANVSTLVQEIVNQGAWASGNAMAILFIGNGSASGRYVTPYLWDYFSGTYKTNLNITVSGGGGVTAHNLTLLGVGR